MPYSFSTPAATEPSGAAAADHSPCRLAPAGGQQRDLTPQASPASGAPSSSLGAGDADCWIEDCEKTATQDGLCTWHAADYRAFRAHLFGDNS